jgi:hypothetical protein
LGLFRRRASRTVLGEGCRRTLLDANAEMKRQSNSRLNLETADERRPTQIEPGWAS